MLDAKPSDLLQRVSGRADVGLTHGAVKRLYQSGAAKVMMPRVAGPPEVVFLNTAGGITGGDQLDYAAQVQGRAVLTTQTAERAYRTPNGLGRISTRLRVDGAVDWLPQETILFNGAGLRRRLEVELIGDARFVFCEMLVFGRKAMGEVLRDLNFSDRREIRRDGRLIYSEPIRVNSADLARSAEPALLAGASVLATIGVFATDTERHVAPLRNILADHPIRAAVSAWDGKLVARLMGDDSHDVKRCAAACLDALRGQDVPRVWQI